ncbi:MAG: SDR family oxidoreductase [Deltaproteobacteria bacterium]|nr:SDR family oxidoreductase [Deltaproteobacteria bacterium]MBW2383968.1 SDR family oxidoreductase [Deltaproteobacteria bacterium]
MRDLRDKVVVVTGAASGIGKALARGLCAKRAHLALVDIDEARLTEIATELEASGQRVSRHQADVGDRQRMQALPDEVLAEHGRVDVLINNAGVSVGAMFVDHSIDDAEWLLRINLMGVIYGCKFFLPELLKAESAHIVNLSSMFGIFAMPGQALYSTSKAGVRAFTEALWTELDGTSVRLTCVHPGGIRTNVIRSARGMEAGDKARAVELQERFAMPAQRAAAKVIRAIERDRRRVLIGVDAHIGVFLKRLFPVGFQRLMTLVFRLGSSRKSSGKSSGGWGGKSSGQ